MEVTLGFTTAVDVRLVGIERRLDGSAAFVVEATIQVQV